MQSRISDGMGTVPDAGAQLLTALQAGVPLLDALALLGRVALFQRKGGVFELSINRGFPQGGALQFSFLEEEGLAERLRPGYFLAADASDRVWVAVDSPENPASLLVLGLADADPGLGPLLACALALQRPGSLPALPIWLERLRQDLQNSTGHALVLSEPGSGVEQVEQRLIGPGLALLPGCEFSPARLSNKIQLRELFGDDAGRRLGGGAPVVPLIDRLLPYLFIKEPLDLTLAAQERLALQLPGAATRWVFFTEFDLERLAEAGRFSGDLLAAIPLRLQVPSLRSLGAELEPEILRQLNLLQIRHGRQVHLDPAALAQFMEYAWPGNIRELESVLELAFLEAREGLIGAKEARSALAAGPEVSGQSELDLRQRIVELERGLLLKAYILHGGNQVQMARALGISRGSLQYKLEKYGLVS